MSAICENCGKGTSAGRSQTHNRGVAGKRWKHRVSATLRLFRPNLQLATILSGGEEKRMTLCAKCIKRYKKYKKL